MIEIYICPNCDADFEDFDEFFEHYTCCGEDGESDE